MKTKIGVLLFVSLCFSGCATTDQLALELVNERLTALETNVTKLVEKVEDPQQNTNSSKIKAAQIAQNKELINSVKELTKACSRIEEAFERERIIRIEMEKEKNPRDYGLYLEMRKKFE